MENNDLLQTELLIEYTAASHLSEMAKWSRFLSVAGFIFCGLFIILGLAVAGSSSSDVFAGSAFGSGMGAFLGIFYLLLSVLYFFPCLFLYRFSTRMKTALAHTNQELFNDALNQHRRLYKFVGVLTIVVIGAYVLGILAVILINISD